MAQEDYVISDQTGISFLGDLNDTLAAIVSNNSGSTEPATMYAYMYWADTTAGILKQRNAANNAWINVFTLVGIKASDIRSTAAGGIAATNVEAALNELDTDKAALAGATFTGRLIASLNSNISLSGINGSFIVGGDGSGSHIAMDSNEIQAKGSPTTTSALFINNEGGRVEFGGDITAVGADFGGDITAVGADFGGDITAVGAAFSGDITAVGAAFSGDILAPKLTASTGVLFGTDTAAANTLDDYEEGTWTPAFVGGSGISYSVQSGKYSKIGNVVNCTASLTVTASSNDNSAVTIGGLPFAADDSHESVNAAIGRFSDFLDSFSELVSQYRLSSTAVLFLKNSDTYITYTDAKSTGSLQIAFSYLT